MTTTEVVAPRRRGAVLLLGAQWGRYASQIVGIVILARIVGPSDFGVVALAAAVAGLASVLGDFGLSMAALRAPSLTSEQRSNLFWINLGVGAAATGIVLAIAQPFASAFHDDRLVSVMVLLAPAFILRSASAQLRVELNRSGRLGRLAASEFAGDVSGLVVAIVLALLGGGYLALALQGTLAAAVTLVLAFVLTPWRPGLPRRRTQMSGLLTFGGNSFLVHVLNYTSTNISTVMIARSATNEVIGLFNRATQLVNLPIDQLITPLTRVVIPGLSASSDATDLSARLVRFQTALCYPALAYLSLFVATAHPALGVVLGSEWSAASVFVPVIALGALFQTLGYPQYWAFVSTGRSGLLLMSEVVGRVVMIALAVAVAPMGPLAVAWAGAAGQILLWAAAACVFLPRAGVPSWPLLRAGMRPVAIFGCSLAMAVCADAIFFATAADSVRLLETGAVWAIAATALTAALGREDIRSIARVFRRR